jgi:hypothetical protein
MWSIIFFTEFMVFKEWDRRESAQITKFRILLIVTIYQVAGARLKYIWPSGVKAEYAKHSENVQRKSSENGGGNGGGETFPHGCREAGRCGLPQHTVWRGAMIL